MDGFGDDFGQADVDPAAEFLAREQDQLAGLEDELDPIAAPADNVADTPFFAPEMDTTVSETIEPNGSFEIVDSFGQQDGLDSFGQVSELDDAVPSESAATADEATQEDIQDESQVFPSTPAAPKVIREEPEKIRKWREEQKQRLEEKDAAEEVKKEELRENARKELDEWYKHHEEQIAKTKAANRNAEKQFVAEVDEIEPGTEWERIAKLCDFNPKSSKSSKDVSRMRSIILQLKQAPLPTKA